MFEVTINQTIALAGLYQALALIQQVAWQGDSTHSCLPASLESILKIDTDDFMDVYGVTGNLQLGLHALQETLEKRRDPHVIERTRHAVSLMYLESKLQTSAQAVTLLRDDIRRITALHTSRDEPITELAQDLGRLYQAHISPLGPKIIIEGNPGYLKMEQCAGMVRALLLAGIRAIVLWHQAQGKRWALLFGRASILRNIAALKQGSPY